VAVPHPASPRLALPRMSAHQRAGAVSARRGQRLVIRRPTPTFKGQDADGDENLPAGMTTPAPSCGSSPEPSRATSTEPAQGVEVELAVLVTVVVEVVVVVLVVVLVVVCGGAVVVEVDVVVLALVVGFDFPPLAVTDLVTVVVEPPPPLAISSATAAPMISATSATTRNCQNGGPPGRRSAPHEGQNCALGATGFPHWGQTRSYSGSRSGGTLIAWWEPTGETGELLATRRTHAIGRSVQTLSLKLDGQHADVRGDPSRACYHLKQ
jgi:hypothetical protein